ncbi:MAG TPA: class I SAM-dependent methyltransferase [Solirubrobacteraceae bacterium]|jgi:hypothetical protein|nr:class I SAM-dependent methyltransferase [Solirubrobacteraceae bacterium]
MSDEQLAKLYIPPDNRPAPLTDPPVPILGDHVCQMSFGERAALVGILGQRKPRLAIEIGTYEGGSLRFLAAQCEHVHTLDLHDHIDDRTPFSNVTFHIGDSKLLLPDLLGRLEAESRAIDLALIDGDHSAPGVQRDLANLLDSSAARSTIILLHDTMSGETRCGIEALDLAAHPAVAYYELDFIPGYEFAGGHFDAQAWGGLGMVITGDRDSHGYGASTRQSLYRQAFEFRAEAGLLKAETGLLQDELAASRREVERSRRWVDAMESSLSWRLTRPLRWVKRRMTRTPRH